jgi:hypothetical protein
MTKKPKMTYDELERAYELQLREISHAQDLAEMVRPRKVNLIKMPGIDYYGLVQPLYGRGGGDYFNVVNFKRYHLDERITEAERFLKEIAGKDDRDIERSKHLLETLKKNRDRIGIIVADASGHMITDCIPIAHLHSALKIGVIRELREHGEVTKRLFEELNTRFYNLMYSPEAVDKPQPFVTFVYGEISNEGIFRYTLGGHPAPIIFSNILNEIRPIDKSQMQSTSPLGVAPSRYNIYSEQFEHNGNTTEELPVNDIKLMGQGDLLLLYTDCLVEHEDEQHVNFADTRLEDILRESKTGTAREIYNRIWEEMRHFAPLQDDFALVVIKKK